MNRTELTFEFPSAVKASDFYADVPADACLSHRVVDVVAEGSDVAAVRELAARLGGRETSSRDSWEHLS